MRHVTDESPEDGTLLLEMRWQADGALLVQTPTEVFSRLLSPVFQRMGKKCGKRRRKRRKDKGRGKEREEEGKVWRDPLTVNF
jgi:hypothetical protein